MHKNRLETQSFIPVLKIFILKGIITNGILRCIGPQVRLKSLYGRGYHLYVNLNNIIA